MNADTPHTRPNSVCPPCVRIASRQSVPSSSAPRFCVIHDTPWPSNVKSTNFELKAMLIGASSVESSVSASALATSRRLPPKRSAASALPSVTTTLTILGRKISSIVNAKRISDSGIFSAGTAASAGEITPANTWMVARIMNNNHSGDDR